MAEQLEIDVKSLKNQLRGGSAESDSLRDIDLLGKTR